MTSKFWPHFAHPDTIELCLDRCLENMGLDYVDLFLAHWPVAMKATSRADLEKARARHAVPPEELGIRKDPETGNEMVDLEYSSKDFGEAVGKHMFWRFWQLGSLSGCMQYGCLCLVERRIYAARVLSTAADLIVVTPDLFSLQ